MGKIAKMSYSLKHPLLMGVQLMKSNIHPYKLRGIQLMIFKRY